MTPVAHRQAALNTGIPWDVRLSHLGTLRDIIAVKHHVKPAGVDWEVLLATDLHLGAPASNVEIAQIVASLQTLNDHWLDLPQSDRNREIIFVMDPDDTPSQDFREIWDWMKRWSGSVRVADYSSGGWEHLWYVEGTAQALAEIREEHRCGGTWFDGTPLTDSQTPSPQHPPPLSSRLLRPLLNLLRPKPLPPLLNMPFSLPSGTPHDVSNPFHLPADLIEFLAANRQLQYDAATSKAGSVTLRPLAALSLGELTLEDPPRSDRDLASDPFIEVPVPAVNLIASAADYDGDYFLCWLPTLRLFANADVEHNEITIFPDVTWTAITADPSRYLDAQWQTKGWRRLLASDLS